MSNKIRFQSDDEDENFEISDTDDYYTETEKALLKKATKQKQEYVDSEEEVLEILSSSEDEDSDENAESDIENIEDNLPDDRAWGKRKKDYYSTDYVDADLNVFNEKDVDAAHFEEEEAKKIQQRLLEQFDEDDFSLDVFKPKSKEVDDDHQVKATKIKKDLSKFLDSEKRELLLKESPELIGLIDDFKVKINEISETLGPVLDILRKSQSKDDNLLQYIHLKYNISMRYLIYINFYLLLKSERVNVKYHPVIKQIIKYRELYSQLESANTEALQNRIHQILTTQTVVEKTKPKKKVKSTEMKQKVVKIVEPPKPTKQVRFEEKQVEKQATNNSSDEDDDAMEVDENDTNEIADNTDSGKRAITYQMAKNKGLTPHRKKEQRNPRVKHRNKYRQAKIRRKGAVREVRKELSRYGGEISGIKSNVTKSIKIK